MTFTCDACKKCIEHEVGSAKGALPPGWRMHDIEGERWFLCSSCGHTAHFADGLSPALRDMLARRRSERQENCDLLNAAEGQKEC